MRSLSSKRLYMRGIAKDVIEEDLVKYLSRYGNISEVKMLSNYTFVQFESEQAASLVLETYKSQPLMGRRVVIEFARPLRKDMASLSSTGSSPKSNFMSRSANIRHPVVVLGLPRDTRWQELKDFGRMSGMLVAYCDLDKTQDGRGFIEFFTREDAQHAVRALDGKRLGGQKIRVFDHEELPHPRKRACVWDRRRSQSPKRQSRTDGHSRYRVHGEDLSARHHYSPIRQMSAVDFPYEHAEHRYSETFSQAMLSSNAAYGEHFNWTHDVAENTSFERASYEYQAQDHAAPPRIYYNLGAYDEEQQRPETQHFQLIDPYQ